LYQDTMREKLDYMKRKRLMEESDKLSRQGKLMDDKEKSKLAEKAATKEAKMQIANLENAGYTRPIAVGIIAGGKSAVDRAIEFSNSLEVDPETGLKPNVSTYFQLTSNAKPISDMPRERRTDLTQRSPDDWVSLASKFYNPYSDIPSGIGARRIKGPVPKQEVASDDALFKQLNTIRAKLAVRDDRPINDFLNKAEIESVKSITGGSLDLTAFDKAYKVLEKRFITDKTGKTEQEIQQILSKNAVDAADKTINRAKRLSVGLFTQHTEGLGFIQATLDRGNTPDFINYFQNLITALEGAGTEYTEVPAYAASIRQVNNEFKSLIKRSSDLQYRKSVQENVPIKEYDNTAAYNKAAEDRKIKQGELVKVSGAFGIHSGYNLQTKKGIIYTSGVEF